MVRDGRGGGVDLFCRVTRVEGGELQGLESLPLSSPFCEERPELRQGIAAEVAGRRDACLLCGQHPVAGIMISFYRVGVGVDRDEDAFVKRIADPSPVHVETARMGIQLDHRLIFRTGIDDPFMVYRITGAAEQQTAGGMSQYGSMGV